MDKTETKELEVKVLNVDLHEMEEKLIKLGAELVSKELQVNTLIDSEERSIEKSLDSYLRLRETKSLLTGETNFTLTMKKNMNREDIRENIEINTDISDKKSMLEILKSLGYFPYNEGFKERTSYILNNIRFDLDKWDDSTYPYPYMEIEVNHESELGDIVKLLGISKEQISTKSILDLRNDLKL